jgi:hypothetical protein
MPSFAQRPKTPRPAAVRENLLEADRHRAIDRYIDSFGGPGTARVTRESDPCGEGLLDALATEEDADND